jgi:hypothetical protein
MALTMASCCCQGCTAPRSHLGTKSLGTNRRPLLPRLALAMVAAMIAAWMSARSGPIGPATFS